MLSSYRQLTLRSHCNDGLMLRRASQRFCDISLGFWSFRRYKMARKKSISVADVERLVEPKKGNVAAIARALGVSRSTVWSRVQESVTLQRALHDARETMLDNVESRLYSNALKGNVPSILFILRTQGGRRGWNERVEHVGEGGGPIKITEVVVERPSVHRTVADEWRDQGIG